MKTILAVLSILAICTTSLGVFYDRLEQRFLPKTSGLMVEDIPDNYVVTKNKSSYQGIHPRSVKRPEETFPFPIELNETGPVKPLFAELNVYPFICGTEHSDLGQPLVDNQSHYGIAVYELNDTGQKTNKVVGYSKDCRLPTRIQYYVKDKQAQGFIKINSLDELEQEDGQVIRIESGTINRFIYILALPVNKQDSPRVFNNSKWNQKLIYRFKGGVGVGYKQGFVNIDRLLYEHEDQLQQGYAIAFSTGTQTSNHYDIWLSEDTALRVKHQFESRYGKALYTIGIGGSGGAIQQYLLAQNHPGLIDAAIPLYSYPDMVTQVSYALDCELMEYYFDVISPTKFWQSWGNRSLIEGSNALDGYKNRYGKLQGVSAMFHGDFTMMPSGASECTNGWRGPSHLINNPVFFSDFSEVAPELLGQVDWSHWGNLSHIYGTDENALGRRFWGNDGVQYGLQSLVDGKLSLQEFINVNRNIGGWKQPKDMQNERFWHISGDDSIRNVSLWGHQNMTHEGRRELASRSHGDKQAAAAAYDSGLVFLGLANLPIIDMRHYLDHQLDMHHAMASFASRKRIEYAMGTSDHQLIWMMEKNDAISRRDLFRSLPINDALRVIDQWIFNIRTHPEYSVAQNRPDKASDRCYDKDHNIIDSSENTWDGEWNHKPSGVCQQRFPHFSQSRAIAGESIYGDTLYCEKISVRRAINDGLYGHVDMTSYLPELERIFPSGVCQYPKGVNKRVSQLVKTLSVESKH